MEVFYVFSLYKLCALSPVVIVYDESDNFHCLPVTHSIMCLIFKTEILYSLIIYNPPSDEGSLANICRYSVPIVYILYLAITRIWTGFVVVFVVGHVTFK